MIRVTPGATFRVVLHERTTATHLLLVFYCLTTCTRVRCIVPATGDDPIIAVVSETSPDAAVALDGEVVLSPRGEWELTAYTQSSDTDLDETSATARTQVAEKIEVFVEPSCCTITAYSPETPATGGTCDGVDIDDQDGNLIQHIADGGTYVVTLADAIVDPLTATADVIVDPL